MKKNTWLLKVISLYSRFGFVAHGLTFICFGIVSLIFIVKYNKTVDFKGTFIDLVGALYGKILILVIAAGLAGFAVWRFLQCFFNAENKEDSLWSYFIRFIYFVLGCFYLWVAWSLLMLLWTQGGTSSNAFIHQEASFLLKHWYGEIILLIIGLVLAGLGFYQLYLTVTGTFMDTIVLSKTSKNSRYFLQITGRIGFAARGVIFIVIAILIFLALAYKNPFEPGNQGRALQVLSQIPAGYTLSIIESIALIIYGIYESANYRYRYIFRGEKKRGDYE